MATRLTRLDGAWAHLSPTVGTAETADAPYPLPANGWSNHGFHLRLKQWEREIAGVCGGFGGILLGCHSVCGVGQAF